MGWAPATLKPALIGYRGSVGGAHTYRGTLELWGRGIVSFLIVHTCPHRRMPTYIKNRCLRCIRVRL